MNRHNNRLYSLYPMILAVIMAVGILIGSRMNFGDYSQQSDIGKINEIINIISDKYVDPVSKEELIERTLKHLLQELDPHSVYVTPEEYQQQLEQIEGKFEGIGVEFRMLHDTLTVVRTIEGGPSELVGILPGDKIVIVEGQTIAGIGIDNTSIMDMLRGKSGTEVTIEVVRSGESELIKYTITRGAIPTTSVDAYFMITDNIGYIKLSAFSRNSHQEFIDAASILIQQGMTSLVFDLRDNGGGLLEAAVNIADEFLEDGKLIVYTDGSNHNKDEEFATSMGSLEDIPVAVLINQGSASASEIVAGALQDNDKCVIIGMRSFGKGLVQLPMDFDDGSGLRLTIARYYTPTGRCIQRPYLPGEDYMDYYTYPFEDNDTIEPPDSLKFTTPGGKVVYGGGGIAPDIRLEQDSIYASLYYLQGIIMDYAFGYVDSHRDELSNYHSFSEFALMYDVPSEVYDGLTSETLIYGIHPQELELFTTKENLILLLKAEMARSIWSSDGYFRVYHPLDNVLMRAVQELQ